MEVFFGLLIFYWIISAMGSAFGGSDRSGASGPLQARVRQDRLGEGEDAFDAVAVEAVGAFTLPGLRWGDKDVAFWISVLDKTDDGEWKPVITPITQFQEPESAAYTSRVEIGRMSNTHQINDWFRIGAVLPQLITPPHKGQRDLAIVVRLIDLSNPPIVMYGFADPDGPAPLFEQILDYSHHFAEPGYIDDIENVKKARPLTIQLGVCVAFSDGKFHPSEGNTIKNWIKKHLDGVEDYAEKSELKASLNATLKTSFNEGKAGTLDLDNILNKFNQIGNNHTKYEAIELCFDIMAADGIADAKELKIIRDIGKRLDLDVGEMEKLKDQKIVGLQTNIAEKASGEEILGIEPSWDNAKKQKFLINAFRKWNSHMEVLEDQGEKDNCQQMIDLISQLRKKYKSDR